MVTNVRCVYRELGADYARGMPGLSSRPCRSPRTGSGPPHAQTCLLYCKTALREGANGTFSSTSLSWRVSIAEERKVWFEKVPLSPFPIKILYRRELHKTTPTNFLYHVRLTYWLPLQLLCAELYLNLKGTQMGSPPVEHGAVSSRRSRIT